MVGVHGSLIDSLAGVGGVAEVLFGRRPAQLGALPAVCLFSIGTTNIDYQMPGSADEDDKTKDKTYRVRLEVYHTTLAGAEVLGEAVEQRMETRATQDALCSLTAGQPDAVSIWDEGGELYEPYRDFAGLTPDQPLIPHRGVMNYAVRIRREV